MPRFATIQKAQERCRELELQLRDAAAEKRYSDTEVSQLRDRNASLEERLRAARASEEETLQEVRRVREELAASHQSLKASNEAAERQRKLLSDLEAELEERAPLDPLLTLLRQHGSTKSQEEFDSMTQEDIARYERYGVPQSREGTGVAIVYSAVALLPSAVCVQVIGFHPHCLGLSIERFGRRRSR